jgi:hypothetical protein
MQKYLSITITINRLWDQLPPKPKLFLSVSSQFPPWILNFVLWESDVDYFKWKRSKQLYFSLQIFPTLDLHQIETKSYTKRINSSFKLSIFLWRKHVLKHYLCGGLQSEIQALYSNSALRPPNIPHSTYRSSGNRCFQVCSHKFHRCKKFIFTMNSEILCVPQPRTLKVNWWPSVPSYPHLGIFWLVFKSLWMLSNKFFQPWTHWIAA